MLEFFVDTVSREKWYDILNCFDDSSYQQSWDFGALAGYTLSHLVAIENNKIIAACQTNIRYILPKLKIGFAHIKMGPLVKKKNDVINIKILRDIIKYLKFEYCIKRGLLLRIEPQYVGDIKNAFENYLNSEDFKKNYSVSPYRTFFLDLSPSLKELRENFDSKWRNRLKKAEKSNLTVSYDNRDLAFNDLISLALEMIRRKNLDRKLIKEFFFFKKLQYLMPENYKFIIFTCKKNSIAVSSALISVFGNTAVYRLGASSEKGLANNASYLIQWHILSFLKEIGVRFYDLGGINPESNPGVYHFKKGLVGKSGKEETFLGEYIGAFNLKEKLLFKLYNYYRKLIKKNLF